jgi:murein DD-endopeptidase
MGRWLHIALIGIVASFALMTWSEEPHQSFDIVVPESPTPVMTEDHVSLVYELHLTNFASEPLFVRRLKIIDSDTGKELASFAESSLAHRFTLVGGPHSSGESLTDDAIRPGERAMIFVELTVEIGAVPRRLRHEISYADSSDGHLMTSDSPTVIMNGMTPVVLGPPFRDGIWVAIHAPSWPRGHRRTTYTLTGKVRIPGRFAVDWIGVDAQGRITHGDPDSSKDSIGYGASILAGADAVVASVRDGVEESASIRNNPKHALGYGAGNYVALNLGSGRYAFYEHLRPGSICVRVGQHVRKGQVIGALGFSGDTTEPHLHLHVADGADPLEAEGLPFVIGPYKEIGRYGNVGDLGKSSWEPTPVKEIRHRRTDWPGSNVVVRFDEK